MFWYISHGQLKPVSPKLPRQHTNILKTKTVIEREGEARHFVKSVPDIARSSCCCCWRWWWWWWWWAKTCRLQPGWRTAAVTRRRSDERRVSERMRIWQCSAQYQGTGESILASHVDSFMPIRRNQSRNVEIMILQWVITKVRNPEHRDDCVYIFGR